MRTARRTPPRRLRSGSPGELGRRFGLPVECADERFTTQAARSAIADAGVRGAAARAARDQVSAQLILQGWFDERRDGAA